MKKILVQMIMMSSILMFATVSGFGSNNLAVLTMNGNFKGYSHFTFFIDADNNPNTGYSKGKTKGADFLVQENGLYSYPKGAKGWKWKKVNSDVTVTHTATSMKSEIPTALLNSSTTIKYNASISTDKWKKTLILASKSLDINVAQTTTPPVIIINSKFINISKKSGGVEIVSIKSAGENVLKSGSKLFELNIKNLSNANNKMIDSLAGWGSVALDTTASQIKATFSNPKDANLPKSLKVVSTIDIKGTKSTWHIKVDGVGSGHSIVDIYTPKLKFNILNNGKFLIPKYTGRVLDVQTQAIKENMLYPGGWQSTMQFLAYYNDKVGLYIGNHDPKASTKKFKIVKKDGFVEYSTNIIPPNKTVANNNFTQSGVFELDSFKGDWYDASLIYKAWASQKAEYWPKMTAKRMSRQHKLGEIALWASSIYVSAIENSNRTRESKDNHISNYLTNVQKIIEDYAAAFPNIGLGIFWHEWYGKRHDTNFPSVFFPTDTENAKIKQMMANVKQKQPNVQFMPYINGLLHNVNLSSFDENLALKRADGSNVMYYPRGSQDRGIPEREFARMDPTQAAWQDTIKKASDVVFNKIGADAINVDQVTASDAIEDMAKNHNHPLAGGHWWRDGYNEMFTKIDSVAKGSQYVTSEGANEFISNHVDGFFVHWQGIDNMVAAYQAVYGGKMQLFGLDMDTSAYNNNSFYMQYAQSFTHGMQLGIISTYLTKDTKTGAQRAFDFVKKLATMRYDLREFLSYGQMLKDVKVRGDIPTLTGVLKNDKDLLHMKALQHSVYKNEAGDKVAFLFTNASLTESMNFSFDIDPSKYVLGDSLSVSKMSYTGTKQDESITGKTTKDVMLKPLESVVFVVSR